MKQYLDLLNMILTNGEERLDRTGVGTIGIFGVQTRYDLRKNFPIITTKKIWMKGVIYELLWMLRGESNIDYLLKNNVHIWDEWADESGDLGPVYGVQWRSWKSKDESTIDQIKNVIHSIKNNPYSRRHIVSAWNVAEIDSMKLPPCHTMFQFYVSNNRELSCHLYQRSNDFFLGNNFNVASYSLLTHMIAQVCDLKVGDFIHTIGDAHIYKSHIDQVKEQLGREPYEPTAILKLNKEIKNIDDFTFDDIILTNYLHHPAIHAKVAV